MRLPRLLRTASFRLASFYAAAFGVSVMILGAVVYYSATSAIEDQYRSRIEAEASALSDIYASGGARALRAAITERESQRRFAGVEHALYDVKGKLIFGPIPGNMPKLGWSIVTGPPDGDEDLGDETRDAARSSQFGVDRAGEMRCGEGDAGRRATVGDLVVALP